MLEVVRSPTPEEAAEAERVLREHREQRRAVDARLELIAAKAKACGKVCRRCGEQLPLSEFPPNARSRDGLASWCRSCAADASAAWRANNPESVQDRNAARRIVQEPKVCREPGCNATFHGPRRDSTLCDEHRRSHRRKVSA